MRLSPHTTDEPKTLKIKSKALNSQRLTAAFISDFHKYRMKIVIL